MQTLYFETVDSTNEVAKRLFAEGNIQELTCILAQHQTAGKGTQGRTWLSPPGAGLYLSIIHCEPAYSIPTCPIYSLAAGVACAKAIATLTDYRIQLKPVNDLYANGQKLGGILTECLYRQDKAQALITGIGINLLQAPRPLPPEDTNRPICLEELLGPPLTWDWNLDQLTAAILQHLEAEYRLLFAGQTEPILAAWKSYQLPGTHLHLPPSL